MGLGKGRLAESRFSDGHETTFWKSNMETLIEHLKTTKPAGFAPRPFYSAEGDTLTFYFKDEESYRERVDDFLTVYKSIESDKLVGCQLKGLPQALKLLGDFGLIIEDGSIRLGMIFIACMAASPEAEARKRYVELGKVARGASIPAAELEPLLS